MMLLVNIILAITVCVVGISRAAPATTMATTPQCPNVNGMTTIDMTKLTGLWYLVAMTPTSINQTCPLQCPRITFSQSTSNIQSMILNTDYTSYMLMYSCTIVNTTLVETFDVFGRQPNLAEHLQQAINREAMLMSPPIASPVSSTPAMPSMTTIPEADNKIERKYPVSERFNTLLPYECNPLQTIEPLIADGLSWSFDTSQFTKAQFVRIEGTAIFTGYFWPFTKDHDKFDALLKMIIHFFVADDHDETVYGHIDRDADKAAAILGQLYAVCDKLEGKDAGGRHVSAIRWKPYILAAYAVYNEIYLALNEVQKRRFLHVFREWNEGMIEECYDLQAKRKFNNLDEYIEVRGKSIATMPLLHLIEYADNLYVPEPEWNHPSMQALFAHLNRALIICNDMYSFEKELLDAGGRPD
ncbi:unnamed protein product, partial [Medioppia subpectinata]